jgi:hypothetical protein
MRQAITASPVYAGRGEKRRDVFYPEMPAAQ